MELKVKGEEEGRGGRQGKGMEEEDHLRTDPGGKSPGSEITNRAYDEVSDDARSATRTRLSLTPTGERKQDPKPMKTRLGLIFWATSTLLLVAVSACGSNQADPPSSPSTTSPSSSPTTSASPPSPSDSAATHASSVLHRYFGVLDRVRRDPSISLSVLATVAASTQLTSESHLVSAERSRSLHQTGATSIRRLTVQSVNLDNSAPAAGRVPTVTIDVCWDVSHADLVDKNGTSAVSPTRANRGWTRYTVANYHWKANPTGGWRVASSQDLRQTPCAA